MKQQSWNKAKRWFAWLGGGVIVLCLAAGGFWYWINIPPQVKIPTPVMPNPNGFDYFRRAGAAFVKDSKGVDKSIDSSNSSKSKKYPLAAKEAWLKKNAKAFHLLREGLKYPALHKPVSSGSSASYPAYAQYRKLARALVVESHARAERGDWNGAVQSVLDDYHFGNQIARGGSLIAGMTSVAVRAISFHELGNLVSHTNATTAKMAAASMDKMDEQRYPYYKTLQEQKWDDVAEYLRIMREPSWRVELMHSFNSPIFDDPDNRSSWFNNAKILILSKRKLIHDLISMSDRLIDNAHQPYTKQRPILVTGDPLVDTMRPIYKSSRWLWARNNTYGVEIMTTYALRAYKMDNGHYPNTLKALVPAYLHKVPIDPFDGIAPLHYQLQGNKYLLWSIGSDGVDNHGKPITNLDRKGRGRYWISSPDSKGDVMAGINMP